jgi:hypothetical protein
MSGLTFTLDPSSSLPDTALDAPEVGPHVAGGTLGFSTTPSLQGIAFVLGVEANAGLSLFNSPDDKDADGVLGLQPAGPPGFERLVLPPGVLLASDRAWLKYRVAAGAKVSAAGALAPVSFKVDGRAGVVFADYHVHDRHERLREAVKTTMAGGRLRILANVDDAFELRPGEALAYLVRGELTASVALSWGDILGAASVSLARLLGPGQTLGVAVSAGATVRFDVAIVDDFRLIVTRGAVRDVRVAVAKGTSRDVAAGAAAKIAVKFADERAAKATLQRLYEAVAGQPVAAVDAVLAKASLDALTAAERKLVKQLAERVGLGTVTASIEALRERWDALKARIDATIAEAARSKVELGFAYEYRRTTTDDTLLVVELSKDEYRRFHGNLLLCELRPMLAWLDDPAQAAALVSYLHAKSVTRSHAWGFTLGVGPWRLAGKDRQEVSAVVQTTRRDGAMLERHAYLGLRAYEAAVFGSACEWVVDFKAEQPEFVDAGRATAADLEYGLHLRLRWKEKKLSKGELREFLDYAVIWRIVSLRGTAEIEEEIAGALGKKKAEVAVALTIPHAAFRALLGAIGNGSSEEFGSRALAKAMPYLADYDGRRQPVVREACYTPLWRFYLENPSLPIEAYGPIAERAIRKMTELEDEVELANRERGLWPGKPVHQDLYTFAGQIHSNGGPTVRGDYSDIASRWRAYVGAHRMLDRAIAGGEPHGVVKEVFKAFSGFWSQWLFVRAAGVCLMDLAAADAALFGSIERTCTVAVEGEDVRHYSTAM